MVDIEADGPIPGKYSMIAIGAVLVDTSLNCSFYRTLKPISDNYSEKALSISGFSRENTLKFDDAGDVMLDFKIWINKNSKGQPKFISDNNGFDWMFVCWYFHNFLDMNPFGHSSYNLGSLYKGLVKDFKLNFKHLRKTKHTHNPLDDAIGNAEAFLDIIQEYNIKINL